jgi:hypothetical protein
VAENAERRVTPHLALLTGETLERSRAVIAENCRRLRTGEPLLHRVACTEYSARFFTGWPVLNIPQHYCRGRHFAVGIAP